MRGEIKLPASIIIPPKDFRQQVLSDIQKGGYGPKYALEALANYYKVHKPSLVTMSELYVVSSCLYGEAEDSWGVGAEAMYMPQDMQWKICKVKTNEDFIVVNPEVDVTEYPTHLIEEFYHHLFKYKPELLTGYEYSEEFACMMIDLAWRVM